MPNKWLFCQKNTVIADGIERKETEECLLTAIINKTNFYAHCQLYAVVLTSKRIFFMNF